MREGDDAMVIVRGLRKRHAGAVRDVLAGIDLDVARGQVLALLGPSGGGKSTLLRCLNGLESFDEGEIAIAGELLRPGPAVTRADRERHRRLRARVGMIFQGYHLFPHLDAVENVALAPVVAHGHARRAALEDAERLLVRVGLEHRMHARPASMSGGEQQRVAIARALATRPDVLLLDEPTAALDPERRVEVLRLVRELASGGQTMVLVTHEVEFAREAADRAALLDGGVVLEKGPARDVLTNPAVPRVRAFLRVVSSAVG